MTDMYTDSSNGQTQLMFTSIGRRDKGEYRVVIENTHQIIPYELSRVETLFSVDVSIQPAQPTDLTTQDVTDTSATTLTWSLLTRTDDESADNQTISIRYNMNGSVAVQRVVEGTARQVPLSLLPGHQYTGQILAANQDGTSLSTNYTFWTSFGGML